MVRRKQTQQARTLHLLFPLDQGSFEYEQEARENPVVQEVMRLFDAKIATIAPLLPNAQVPSRKKQAS